MFKKIVKNLIFLVPLLGLSGCASLWEQISIGKMKGKAEEMGLNYEDTGLIADPYFLYKNRKNLDSSKIYPNSKCREDCKQNSLLQEGTE